MTQRTLSPLFVQIPLIFGAWWAASSTAFGGATCALDIPDLTLPPDVINGWDWCDTAADANGYEYQLLAGGKGLGGIWTNVTGQKYLCSGCTNSSEEYAWDGNTIAVVRFDAPGQTGSIFVRPTLSIDHGGIHVNPGPWNESGWSVAGQLFLTYPNGFEYHAIDQYSPSGQFNGIAVGDSMEVPLNVDLPLRVSAENHATAKVVWGHGTTGSIVFTWSSASLPGLNPDGTASPIFLDVPRGVTVSSSGGMPGTITNNTWTPAQDDCFAPGEDIYIVQGLPWPCIAALTHAEADVILNRVFHLQELYLPNIAQIDGMLFVTRNRHLTSIDLPNASIGLPGAVGNSVFIDSLPNNQNHLELLNIGGNIWGDVFIEVGSIQELIFGGNISGSLNLTDTVISNLNLNGLSGNLTVATGIITNVNIGGSPGDVTLGDVEGTVVIEGGTGGGILLGNVGGDVLVYGGVAEGIDIDGYVEGDVLVEGGVGGGIDLDSVGGDVIVDGGVAGGVNIDGDVAGTVIVDGGGVGDITIGNVGETVIIDGGGVGDIVIGDTGGSVEVTIVDGGGVGDITIGSVGETVIIDGGGVGDITLGGDVDDGVTVLIEGGDVGDVSLDGSVGGTVLIEGGYVGDISIGGDVGGDVTVEDSGDVNEVIFTNDDGGANTAGGTPQLIGGNFTIRNCNSVVGVSNAPAPVGVTDIEVGDGAGHTRLEMAPNSLTPGQRFSITTLTPAQLVPSNGWNANNQPVMLFPVTGASYDFLGQTLSAPATVTLRVVMAELPDVVRHALIARLANDDVSLAYKFNAFDDPFTLLPICAGKQTPTPLGCVELWMYDSDGLIVSSPSLAAEVLVVGEIQDSRTIALAFECANDKCLDDVTCIGDIVASATFQPPADGFVDGADLAFLLGEWGPNPGSAADLVSTATFEPPPDGVVSGADLAVLLGAWGACR